MIATDCNLISFQVTQDAIGNDIKTEVSRLIPIIKVENVYADEFYQAAQQGLRPTLRLRISLLNYDGELELDYMGKRYSVVRTQDLGDECVLICERKIKNEG